jgi:effector-binding domain-containing protein
MAKNVNTATPAKIEFQAEVPYMGVRRVLSYDGMRPDIEKMRKELEAWFKANAVEANGAPFLRYHCIDMKGHMDMEYGIPVKSPLVGNGSVKAGTLPAGRYVSHIYTGGGYQGNKVLVEWIKENNIPVDRWDTADGDNFAARYEQYLTDPKIETRKTKIEILLAMKLRDE